MPARRSVSAARRRPPTFNQIVETFTNPVNGSPWAGWTAVFGADVGVVDIQSNKGRTQTAAVAYASAGAYLNAATPSDFELAGNATITTVSAGEFYGSINVRAGSTVFESVHQALAWNLRFAGSTGGGYALLYKTDAAGNATAVTVGGQNVGGPNINFVQGSVLRFRVNCTGPRIRVRYWKNAEAEPSVWHIDYTDPTAPTGTSMSVLCRNGGGTAVAADVWDWDDITITDLGSASPPGTVTGSLAQTLANTRSTSGPYDFTVSASQSLQQICDLPEAQLAGRRVLVPAGVWVGGLYIVNKNFGGLVIHLETGAVVRGSTSGIEMYGEILNLTIEGPGAIEGNGTQVYSEGIMIDAARTDKGGNGNAGGNILIDGLTVRPTPGTGSLQRGGITIWGCGGSVIVKNCTIHDCGGNTLGFGGAASGISIGHARRIASAGSMLIDNNLIYNVLDTTGEVSADRNGIIFDQLHGNWAKYVDYFIGPIVCSNNTIHDVSGRGIHLLCGSLSDSLVTITGNEVYGQWARRLGTDPNQGNPKTAIGGYGVGLGGNVVCSNNTVTFDSGNGGKPAYEFSSFDGDGPGVFGTGNRTIGTGTNVAWDNSRTDTPPADFMIGGGATGGGVHWGYDITQENYTAAGGTNATAKAALSSIPNAMITTHIGGFGVYPPETSNNVFDWGGEIRGVPANGLDDGVNHVRGFTGPTGINAIILCTAPGWMKPSGNDFAMEEAPTAAHEQNFADLCRDVCNRYTDVSTFIFWNEMKGLGVGGPPFRWNYQKYVSMYNKAWTVMKAARPNILMGGPYPVSSSASTGTGGNPSTYPGTPPCTFTGGFVDYAALDVFTYFRDAAIGWDFIVCDIWAGNQFGTTIGPGATAVTQSISKFVNQLNWIRTNIEPVKPIIIAESYPILGGMAQTQAEDHLMTLFAAIRDNVAVGEGIWSLGWGESDEPPLPFNYATGAATGLIQKLINWEAAQ